MLKMGNLLNDLNVEAPRVMKEAGEEGELLTHSLTRVNDQYKVYVDLCTRNTFLTVLKGCTLIDFVDL